MPIFKIEYEHPTTGAIASKDVEAPDQEQAVARFQASMMPQRNRPGTGGKGDMKPGDMVEPSLGRSAWEGLTWELGDEAEALGAAAFGNDLPNAGDRYDQSLARRDAVAARTAEDHPYADTALRIGGALASGVPLAMATGGGGILGAIGQGGVFGGIESWGRGRGLEDSVNQGAGGAALGAGLGGILSAAGTGIGKGVKSIFRGTEKNLPGMLKRIEKFKNAGIAPTAGQATMYPWSNSLERLLAANMVSAKPLQDAYAKQQNMLHETLMPGNATRESFIRPDAHELGAQLRDVVGEGATEAADSAGTRLGSLPVPDTLRTAPRHTLKALDDMANPVRGAQAKRTNVGPLNRAATPGIIGQTKRNLEAASRTPKLGKDIGVNWDILQATKENVGKHIKNPPLNLGQTAPADVGKLKQVYKGAINDMEGLAKQAGVADEWKSLRGQYSEAIANQKLIKPLLSKGDQKLFEGLSTAEPKVIATARKLAGPEEWRKVSDAIKERMGLATPTNQTPDGNTWSPLLFMRRYGEMTPGRRKAIWDKGDLLDIDAVADVADIMRDAYRKFSNMSGTTGMAGNAYVVGKSIEAAQQALGGKGRLAAGVAAALTGARVGSTYLAGQDVKKLLNSKAFVNWLSKATKMGEGKRGQMLATLARIGTIESDLAPAIQVLTDELSGGAGKTQDRLEIDIPPLPLRGK